MTLTKIVLWGELGETFAPETDGELLADVSTPKEAINFLCANFPDFKNHVLSQNTCYTMTCNGDNWEKEITPTTPGYQSFPIQGKTLTITPVLAGSGETFGRVFSPILMIGVGLITGNTALIIGGVVQGLQSLLFGYPKKPSEEERSVNFQGGSPRTTEGTPIAIAIGSKVFVRDVMVVSYEIVSEYSKTSKSGGSK